MCSIVGVIHFDKNFETEKSLNQTKSALEQSAHRGPDHSQTSLLPTAAIGHNRLSIIDLNAAANQPMRDDAGRYYLVLNGEIFNYRELRFELQKEGRLFKTQSDTEVLLQLLIVHGESALDMLNGFFAFAFHDMQEDTWIIARDRMGEKPLFFFHDSEKFCFASELRALMQYDFPRVIDPTALSLLLQFSYIPAPSTILKNCKKLLPGHFISISKDADNLKVILKKWYNPSVKKNNNDDRKQVIKSFSKLLNEAVERRLESDVPLGCFLSGGVDSSVIAALAVSHKPNFQTFSLGVSDTPFLDETKYALEVAAHIGSKHEVFDMTRNDFSNEIENVWTAMDEPLADSSSIAVWMLAQKTKGYVSVALSGDGADELLGGYNKHAAILKSTNADWINTMVPKVASVLELFPMGRNNAISNKLRQLNRYSKGIEKSFKERYVYWSSFAEGGFHEDLLKGANIADKGARINRYVSDIRKDDFNTVLLADQALLLAGDMLPKVDTMSMAHALEVRPPFMDHTVVEFINSLDVGYKINAVERKILLRECFENQLPISVFKREKKGFEIPLEKLLRKQLKPIVSELLGESYIQAQDIFKAKIVHLVLNDFYFKRRATHTSLIYSMLVFQVWYKRWF